MSFYSNFSNIFTTALSFLGLNPAAKKYATDTLGQFTENELPGHIKTAAIIAGAAAAAAPLTAAELATAAIGGVTVAMNQDEKDFNAMLESGKDLAKGVYGLAILPAKALHVANNIAWLNSIPTESDLTATTEVIDDMEFEVLSTNRM